MPPLTQKYLYITFYEMFNRQTPQPIIYQTISCKINLQRSKTIETIQWTKTREKDIDNTRQDKIQRRQTTSIIVLCLRHRLCTRMKIGKHTGI